MLAPASVFVAFADELALTYSLKDKGINCSKVTIQTDNGSEFIGSG